MVPYQVVHLRRDFCSRGLHPNNESVALTIETPGAPGEKNEDREINLSMRLVPSG
jgi:hypothetical protein